MFGSNFENFVSPESTEEKAEPAPSTSNPAAVGKATKGKISAKATGHKYQFQIMESIGVPRAEIKKFADPYYWLTYFPPICIVSLHVLANALVVLLNTIIFCRKITQHSAAESTGVAHS